MTDRATLAAAFLQDAGWGDATRRFLAGDASARRYDRLTGPSGRAVLMDAPPDQGEDIAAFERIARHLTGIGLSAPQIYARDAAGFLLLEDLGDDLYARVLALAPAREPALYAGAVQVLVTLQSAPAATDLPDASAADWAAATDVATDWYAFAATGTRTTTNRIADILSDLLFTYADSPRVMILRDYHAENLLWLPDRSGVARVGVLDFQLAQMGQPGYDLVSLCQDARRDVAQETEAAMIRQFLNATGGVADRFEAAYAVLGAQRALRILGVFARLCLNMGKPGYVALMPRVWRQLQANLAHPALRPLALACADLVPEPTPARLERIVAQCPRQAP